MLQLSIKGVGSILGPPANETKQSKAKRKQKQKMKKQEKEVQNRARNKDRDPRMQRTLYYLESPLNCGED